MKGENKMKKILIAIAILMTFGITANAQGKNDAFVMDWGNNDTRFTWGDDLSLILPTTLGNTNDVQAPLGSGLLVLTALGAGYAVVRKRKK